MYHGNSNVVIWDYIVVNNGVLEGLNGHISGWVLWLMGILLKQCNIMLISMVIMWATQCHKQLLFGDWFLPAIYGEFGDGLAWVLNWLISTVIAGLQPFFNYMFHLCCRSYHPMAKIVKGHDDPQWFWVKTESPKVCVNVNDQFGTFVWPIHLHIAIDLSVFLSVYLSIHLSI